MKDYNNYNINPPKVQRYHYYNPNSAKKRNKIPKNFSYVYNNNNNEYIYQYYNNNIYPNINPYQQMMMNNDTNEIRNTENLQQIQNESNNNNSNIVYKDSNNYSIINESRSNNSILNTSEKRHLYYFNDLKYES